MMRKGVAILILALGCAGLSACGQSDWRAAVIGNAEGQIRADVNDPAAEFSGVQVTGDDITGQTCGFVSARLRTGGQRSGRFIVYIDRTAGPYVENGMSTMSHDQFEFAWQNDCVDEGYRD